MNKVKPLNQFCIPKIVNPHKIHRYISFIVIFTLIMFYYSIFSTTHEGLKIVTFIIVALVLALIFALVKNRHYQVEIRAARLSRNRADIINKIAKCINSGLSPEKIISIALEDIAQHFPMYRVSYSTISSQGILTVHSCIPRDDLPSIENVEADLTIAPQYLEALKKQKIVAIGDVENDSLISPLKEAMIAGNTRALLDAPINVKNSVVGLFCLDSASVKHWSAYEIDIIKEVTSYIEIALRQANYVIDIEKMANTLEKYNHNLEEQVRVRTQELEIAKQRAETLAFTDELTQLPNRRAFYKMAEYQHSQAIRYSRPYCVMIFDIDEFKRINDTFGHAAGDVVLSSLAELVRQILRKSDVVGRIGGEEFAVLLPETQIEQAKDLGERLRSQVEQCQVPYEQQTIHYTLSLGVTEQNNFDKSFESILAKADTALYKAKATGRNKVISTD
ncbi:sensor domain-containing diguanylate cyclase [Pseudoalteromonas elyakovii]|nr:sensor domain-containing diguanylate cyclase [Pseudoalteromonas elyakovii]